MKSVVPRLETVTAAGATYNVDVNTLTDLLAIIPQSNPLVMAGNIVVNFTGTAFQGQVIRVGWGEGITLGVNSMTVNGVALTALQASKEGQLEFTYLNGGWGDAFIVDFKKTGQLSGAVLADGTILLSALVSLAAARIIVGSAGNVATAVVMSGDVTIDSSGVMSIGAAKITTAMLASKAVTLAKMDDLARGHAYVGDATNRPAAFDMRTANNILCGNAAGTDPVMAAVGGDLTMPSPGVFRLANTVGAIYRADLVISATQLLTGNATPLEILQALGIGRTINVIDVDVNQTFVATPYTTNLTLEVYTDTATVAQKSLNCLGFTTSRIVKMSDVAISAAGNTQLIPNKGLFVRVASGDPAAGDGTIVLTVYYTILT